MDGVLMFKVLCVMIAAFLVADLWAFFAGETLTQRTIKMKEESLLFRLTIIALIIVASVFLLIHFELFN